MTPATDVAIVLPDKMGGAMTIVANLLRYRSPDLCHYRAVLTHNTLDVDARSTDPLSADRVEHFEYALPVENIYAVAHRLQRALGPGPGVLVCNDFVEMMLLSIVDPGRTVVQILHGDYDYYYDLAVRHEPLVHAFVAYSRTVYDTLLARLPHRADSIFWLPYGVPIPPEARLASDGPLRLVFVGRLDEHKGVFDLPEIDRLLKQLAVSATWTIVGTGPAEAALRARWTAPDVRWTSAATPDAVRAILLEQDVLVLPSRGEGLSVATVEAMSAGVVPVVSDLPSMVEIVDGVHAGLRAPVGDPVAFAQAIATLGRDRDRLETMSRAARRLACERFDARDRARAYQDLFARWRELYRPRPAVVPVPYGSRLDHPWIPNPLVRFVRTALRAAR